VGNNGIRSIFLNTGEGLNFRNQIYIEMQVHMVNCADHVRNTNRVEMEIEFPTRTTYLTETTN